MQGDAGIVGVGGFVGTVGGWAGTEGLCRVGEEQTGGVGDEWEMLVGIAGENKAGDGTAGLMVTAADWQVAQAGGEEDVDLSGAGSWCGLEGGSVPLSREPPVWQPQSLNMPVRAFPGLGVWVVASALAEVWVPMVMKAEGEVAGGRMAW